MLLLLFVLINIICRPLLSSHGASISPVHSTAGTRRQFDGTLRNSVGFGSSPIVPAIADTGNYSEHYSPSKQATGESSDDSSIDVGLYSRQLLVYGKSAQHKMQNAHVLIVGEEHLASEVAKNLALSGIGRISLYSIDGSTTLQAELSSSLGRVVSIMGEDDSLLSYTKSLNFHNQVEDLSSVTGLLTSQEVFSEHGFSSVVCCDCDWDQLKALDALCRRSTVPLVSAGVRGSCGYVFNDFHSDFVVEDVDGELYKEVPLQPVFHAIDETASSRPDEESVPMSKLLLLRVAVIAEEQLSVGMGDRVQLMQSGEKMQYTEDVTARVREVLSRHECLLELSCRHYDIDVLSSIRRAIESGAASMKRMKEQVVVHHQPLVLQLLKPAFCPANECLSAKKDFSLSVCLLACMKVAGYLDIKSDSRIAQDAQLFRIAATEELKTMGIHDPFASVRDKGRVGNETLDWVIERFRQSTSSRCAVSSSIVGAIAAQELIKSVTHLYLPISQFLMIESLDAVSASWNATCEQKGKDDASSRRDDYASIYGSAVMDELSSLKVFVVGSGAIGCELLKNFALLGIGQASAGDPSCDTSSSLVDSEPSLWTSYGLQHGGVLVTDMDSIERSNLNRQLLFRERHVGGSKSLIAAQQVRLINPAMRVQGITSKLGPETESIFNSSFWKQADIVVTALDNVDARRYVDQQCVIHGKWLLDSGTLGTKGNTQVIIPYLTESYSSSADPPDDAIPLCTLKSFPYQADHCVSWAKSVFEDWFMKDVQLVQHLLDLLSRCDRCKVIDDAVAIEIRGWLGGLSEDDHRNLFNTLRYFPWTDRQSLLSWSLDDFDSLFRRTIEQLLVEHPSDETDEGGAPFWGGSRRLPRAIDRFDSEDEEHRTFVLQSALIRSRVFRLNSSSSSSSVTYDELVDSLKQRSMECSDSPRELAHHQRRSVFLSNGSFSSSPDESLAFIAELWRECYEQDEEEEDCRISIKEGLSTDRLHPEAFEKDDVSLGHVALLSAMTNLRCRVYSLPELDALQVQKLAGNIIPALATTTALVGGLVTIEIIKIAQERVQYKQMRREETAVADESQEQSKNDRSKWTPVRAVGQYLLKGHGSSPQKSSTRPAAIAWTDAAPDKAYLTRHKDRLLKLFRNSFVNLARPMIAFAQPSECTDRPFPVTHGSNSDARFNLWDTIEAPSDWRELSIAALDAFLREKYHYLLQSLSLGDNMLFADFLSHQGGSMDSSSTIYDLLIQLFREETPDIDSRDDHSSSSSGAQCSVEESTEKLQSFIEGKQFLLFEITCYHVDEDKEEKEKDEREVDTKLPLLKVSVSTATGRDAARGATDGTVVSSHVKGVFMKLKRFAGWSLHRR